MKKNKHECSILSSFSLCSCGCWLNLFDQSFDWICRQSGITISIWILFLISTLEVKLADSSLTAVAWLMAGVDCSFAMLRRFYFDRRIFHGFVERVGVTGWAALLTIYVIIGCFEAAFFFLLGLPTNFLNQLFEVESKFAILHRQPINFYTASRDVVILSIIGYVELVAVCELWSLFPFKSSKRSKDAKMPSNTFTNNAFLFADSCYI